MRTLFSCLLLSLFAACGGGTAEPDAGLDPLETRDAGAVAEDAGLPGDDAGTSTEEDAGLPTEDAGTSIEDAGTSIEDAGTSIEDAGTSIEDAGTSTEDAGTSTEDAGTSTEDAGVDAGQVIDAGPPPCQCTATQYCVQTVCLEDTTPPQVTIAAQAVGTTVLHVTGTAVDLETGLATVALSINGGAAQPVTVVGGSYAADLPITPGAVSLFTVTARATDLAGNAQSAQASVTVDVVPPSITLTPNTDAQCDTTSCTGAVLTVSDASLTLHATVTDAVGLATGSPVRMRVMDGAATVLSWTDMTQAGNDFSYVWSAPTVDGRFYAVEVSAADAAGNVATKTLVVLVDRVAPILLVTSPQPGALVGTAQVSIGATSTDGLGLRGVEVRASNGAWQSATRSGTTFTGALPVPAVDAVAQSFEVRATDLAGNGTTASGSYVADRVAPRVTLNGADASCTGNACTGLVGSLATSSLTLGGTVVDGEPLASLTVTQRLVKSADQSVVQTQTGAATTGATQFSLSWGPLPAVDGAEYQLQVVASDAAGNASVTQVRKVWVDTVAPTATTSLNGQRLVSRTATVVTFSEPMNPTTVGFTMSPSLPLSSPLQSSDGRAFAWPSGVLDAYTTYTLSIAGTASDKAGNRVSPAPASQTFLTEVQPLTLPVTVPSTSQRHSPRIVLDADGRPLVLSATGTNSTNLALDSFDGRQWVDAPLPLQSGNYAVNDLFINASSTGADLKRSNQLSALNTNRFASNATVSDCELTASGWTCWAAMMTSAYNPSMSHSPVFEPIVSPVPGRPLVTLVDSTRRNLVSGAFNPAWSSSAPIATDRVDAQGGVAYREATSVIPPFTYALRYWNGAALVDVRDVSSTTTVSARPQLQRFRLGQAPQNLSAAYVAAASGSTVDVFCTSAPVAGATWRQGTVDAGASISGPLSTVLTTSNFYVAGAFGGTTRVYAIAQDTACASAPTVTLLGTLPNTQEPSLTVDAAGNVWVVALDANGALVLQRF